MIEYRRVLNTNLVEICIANNAINSDFESLATQLAADTQQLKQFCILLTIQGLEGVDPLIFWKDPRFGFIHMKNFSRAAVLVETQHVQFFERVVESISTAEVKIFKHTQIALARKWLAAKQIIFIRAVPISCALADSPMGLSVFEASSTG